MKKFIWIGVTFVVFVFFIFFSFPMIASTSFGKKIILNVISKKLKGELSIDSWNLSWLGSQVIRNIEFKSEQLEFSSTQLNVDIPFWSFFSFSRLEKQLFQSLDGKGEIINAKIVLHKPNEPSASFEKVDITIAGSNGKNIHVNLMGNTFVENVEGKFNIEAKIDSIDTLFFDFPSLLRIDLSNFPVMGIDRWIQNLQLRKKNLFIETLKKENNFFSRFLGNRLNLDFTFLNKGMSKDLRAFFDATHGQTSINASIKDNKLYLNETLFAKFQLTPAFSEHLIKDINPLFITGVESLNHIILQIDADGFVLPLHPFSIKKLSIQKAKLDMGKVKCKNGGTLSIIIGLMKLHSLQKVNEMTVWFTPVNIQIEDGVAFTDRMDALIANDIHICTWGSINLLNKKLDMILGLTAQALNKSFNLNRLPSDYIMQIPLKGTIDNPDLDASKAAAKIGTLMTSQASAEKFRPLSDILKILGTQEKEESPPAKKPFAWELQPKLENSSKAQKETKIIKQQ